MDRIKEGIDRVIRISTKFNRKPKSRPAQCTLWSWTQKLESPSAAWFPTGVRPEGTPESSCSFKAYHPARREIRALALGQHTSRRWPDKVAGFSSARRQVRNDLSVHEITVSMVGAVESLEDCGWRKKQKGKSSGHWRA